MTLTTDHQRQYEALYQQTGIRDQSSIYRRIAGLIKPAVSWAYLDVACGEGSLLAAVAARAAEARRYGVDISRGAITRALRADPGAHLLVGDAEQLPFKPQTFDAVTCLGSVENFENPIQSLKEIHRVLKDDGLFCTMMPNKWFLGDFLQVWIGQEEQYPFQHVERQATLGQWKRMLSACGFNTTRVEGYTKTVPLLANGKIRSIRKFLSTHLQAWLSPPALAWSIIFVCRKMPVPALPKYTNDTPPPWLWRGEWVIGDRPSVVRVH